MKVKTSDLKAALDTLPAPPKESYFATPTDYCRVELNGAAWITHTSGNREVSRAVAVERGPEEADWQASALSTVLRGLCHVTAGATLEVRAVDGDLTVQSGPLQYRFFGNHAENEAKPTNWRVYGHGDIIPAVRAMANLPLDKGYMHDDVLIGENVVSGNVWGGRVVAWHEAVLTLPQLWIGKEDAKTLGKSAASALLEVSDDLRLLRVTSEGWRVVIPCSECSHPNDAAIAYYLDLPKSAATLDGNLLKKAVKLIGKADGDLTFAFSDSALTVGSKPEYSDQVGSMAKTLPCQHNMPAGTAFRMGNGAKRILGAVSGQCVLSVTSGETWQDPWGKDNEGRIVQLDCPEWSWIGSALPAKPTKE